MRGSELKYANDARNAVENSSAKGAWPLLVFLLATLIAAIAWASWATVEQVTNGIGRVIPSQQTQLVESLEPGIVREILVEVGDEVKVGQKLLTVDDTAAQSRLGELTQKLHALSAERHRLKLQASLVEKFEFPASFPSESKQFYEGQKAVFITEKRQLEERIDILESQFVQIGQRLKETEASTEKQIAALEIAERELELTKKLFSKRAVPELEYLKIRRLVGDLKGDLEVVELSKVRIAAEKREASKKIEAEQSLFVAKAQERITRVNAELAIVTESIKAAKDRVVRADFTSPVSGIVNKVNVATIGEVVQSGATLIEIVPRDGRLLIEVRIRPEDIAFIRPGLVATIRLTAYDYTKFGTLMGLVERIGADTITDEQNETYYQVTVATDPQSEIPEVVKIIPGMVANVDISTGDRTILEYLLKPVLRVRDTAFRDPR